MKVKALILSSLILLLNTNCISLAKNELNQVVKNNSTEKKQSSSDTSYLNDLEKEVVVEINKLRSNPVAYADKIKKVMSYYDGNKLTYPEETTIMTNEGIKPAQECYDFLLTQKPVNTLTLSKGMSKAAKEHALDNEKNSNLSHTGSDGSSPFDRLNRYGTWDITAGENIDFGSNTAEKIVVSLLIDDGVPSRGHRIALLEKEYTFIGVGSAKHKVYRTVFVIDYAGGYTEKQ